MLPSRWPKRGKVDNVSAVFGLTIKPDSPSRRRLALAVLRKSVEVAKEKLARLDGEGSEAAEPWTPAQDGTVLPTSTATTVPQTGRGPLLSKALEFWSRGAKKPAPRVVMDAETGVRRFIELHGDLPLGDVTKRMVREYRTALMKTATRLPKMIRTSPLPELIKQDLSG